MLHFDRELAFVLKRAPYRENSYLLDLFFARYGIVRAVARIKKQKTYRNTENYSPFRELAVSGQQRNTLATLWESDIKGIYQPFGKGILSASYINELMLRFANDISETEALYARYKTTLQTPDAAHLRALEWYFISALGLFPETTAESAYFQLLPSTAGLNLVPTKQGYENALIAQLTRGELPLAHPHLKHLLQAILDYYLPARVRTKTTSVALYKLLR